MCCIRTDLANSHNSVHDFIVAVGFSMRNPSSTAEICTRRRRDCTGSPLGSSRCETSSKKPHSGFNQTCNKGIDFIDNIVTYVINSCYQKWCITNNGQCVYAALQILFKFVVKQIIHFQGKSQGFSC